MNNKKTGFTLIEAMLALFITAIIVTILSIVFNTGLRAFRQGRDILDITKRAQLVVTKMTSELSGAMVLTNVPLQGNVNSIYFVAPLENSSNYELCEVGYYLNNQKLMRYFLTKGSGSFQLPNSVVYNNPTVGGAIDTFCDGVSGLEFHYYNGANWSNTWNNANQLPQLIEIKVTMQSKNTPAKAEEFVTRVYLPNSLSNP